MVTQRALATALATVAIGLMASPGIVHAETPNAGMACMNGKTGYGCNQDRTDPSAELKCYKEGAIGAAVGALGGAQGALGGAAAGCLDSLRGK